MQTLTQHTKALPLAAPRLAVAEDIPAILALQAENLVSNLPPEQQADGFVTTPLTVAHLEELIGGGYAFLIPGESGTAAAYMMTGSWQFFRQWPVFGHMISLMPQLRYAGLTPTPENSFQYGPVCVGAAARGTGALERMFALMRAHHAPRYPLGLTFINKRNHRSFAAHTRKLGVEVITEFEYGDQAFHYMAFGCASGGGNVNRIEQCVTRLGK